MRKKINQTDGVDTPPTTTTTTTTTTDSANKHDTEMGMAEAARMLTTKCEEITKLKEELIRYRTRKKYLRRKVETLTAANTRLTSENGTLTESVDTLTTNNIGSVSLEEHLNVSDKLAELQRGFDDKLLEQQTELASVHKAALISETAAERLKFSHKRETEALQAIVDEQVGSISKLTSSVTELEQKPLMSGVGTQANSGDLFCQDITQVLHFESRERHEIECSSHLLLSLVAQQNTVWTNMVATNYHRTASKAKGEAAGREDCTTLLKKEITTLEEKIHSLKNKLTEMTAESHQSTTEITSLTTTVDEKEQLCQQLSQQVTTLGSKLQRASQKVKTISKLKTDLLASESERTRANSEIEILKGNAKISEELQTRLRKEIDNSEELMKQKSHQMGVLESEVAELRQVRDSRTKDLALLRDLKLQQQIIADETSIRISIINDTSDSLLSTIMAERQSLILGYESNFHHQEQTELIQLVQSQRDQLAVCNEKLDFIQNGDRLTFMMKKLDQLILNNNQNNQPERRYDQNTVVGAEGSNGNVQSPAVPSISTISFPKSTELTEKSLAELARQGQQPSPIIRANSFGQGMLAVKSATEISMSSAISSVVATCAMVGGVIIVVFESNKSAKVIQKAYRRHLLRKDQKINDNFGKESESVPPTPERSPPQQQANFQSLFSQIDAIEFGGRTAIAAEEAVERTCAFDASSADLKNIISRCVIRNVVLGYHSRLILNNIKTLSDANNNNIKEHNSQTPDSNNNTEVTVITVDGDSDLDNSIEPPEEICFEEVEQTSMLLSNPSNACKGDINNGNGGGAIQNIRNNIIPTRRQSSNQLNSSLDDIFMPTDEEDASASFSLASTDSATLALEQKLSFRMQQAVAVNS